MLRGMPPKVFRWPRYCACGARCATPPNLYRPAPRPRRTGPSGLCGCRPALSWRPNTPSEGHVDRRSSHRSRDSGGPVAINTHSAVVAATAALPHAAGLTSCRSGFSIREPGRTSALQLARRSRALRNAAEPCDKLRVGCTGAPGPVTRPAALAQAAGPLRSAGISCARRNAPMTRRPDAASTPKRLRQRRFLLSSLRRACLRLDRPCTTRLPDLQGEIGRLRTRSACARPAPSDA
jgi:hypothetical protein